MLEARDAPGVGANIDPTAAPDPHQLQAGPDPLTNRENRRVDRVRISGGGVKNVEVFLVGSVRNSSSEDLDRYPADRLAASTPSTANSPRTGMFGVPSISRVAPGDETGARATSRQRFGDLDASGH